MKVIKSHIPAINTPAKIAIPEEKSLSITANETKARQKRGRPVGAKDKTPRKRRLVGSLEETTKQVIQTPVFNPLEEEPPEKVSPEEKSPEAELVQENNEISIHYINTGEILNRNKIVVDNVFAFKVALDITRSDDDNEPRSVEEC